MILKKNIKNISNPKSRTKISKINPSDRLISQKITVQSTFHEASACTWSTSTNLVFRQNRCVFLHSKHMCFKTARENGNDGLSARIFFGGVFLGTTRFFAIG